MQTIDKTGQRKKFEFGKKLSKILLKIGIDVRRKIFKQILDQLGGKVRAVISGAAALNTDVAEDFNGEDCLLGYRKYIKDNNTVGAACLFYEMQDSATFYHKNLFFNVTVVSDDQAFLGRTALPF